MHEPWNELVMMPNYDAWKTDAEPEPPRPDPHDAPDETWEQDR